MSHANYSLTVRVAIAAQIGMFGRVMQVIGDAGGEVGGVDIVRSTKTSVIRDITVYARDDAHGEEILANLRALVGVEVLSASDRVMLSHIGGKMTMQNRMPLETRDDLSMAYTPGVARVCMAINHDPERVWDLTIRANSVVVVSDGSSVVGEGDLGPLAALPAVESKCMFLREMAGIDGFPLPVTVRDPDEITNSIAKICSVFAGVHLTDIAAPRCFEVQRKLGAAVDIPVFHDNQEGTSAALLGALLNGLEVVGKRLGDATVVVAGLGPSGVATVRILVAAGVGEVLACNREGSVHAGRTDLGPELAWIGERTNPDRREGDARTLIAGADAFIGLSAPGILSADDIRTMAPDPIVFALALPEPEISLEEAGGVAAVYGTGRPDAPNQINSALAFPGIWRGALDCRATRINDAMVMAAARAIAGTSAGALAPDHVVPSVFNAQLVPNVAAAVREAAEASGVARVEDAAPSRAAAAG
jgi:malate dehydrogenase (oxaloacetate-decarboxylating)